MNLNELINLRDSLRQQWQTARQQKLQCKQQLLQDGVVMQDCRHDKQFRNFQKQQRHFSKRIIHIEKKINRKRSHNEKT